MSSLMSRMKKDLQEATGMDRFIRRIAKLEKEVERIEKGLLDLDKEIGAVSRKTATLTRKGGQKRRPLIDQIEEIVRENGGGPMKVTEIKDILLKDKNVKTRAKNFYAVITVSLNNSGMFQKTAPGEYKLTDGSTKAAPAKKAAGKKAAGKKKAAAKAAPKKRGPKPKAAPQKRGPKPKAAAKKKVTPSAKKAAKKAPAKKKAAK